MIMHDFRFLVPSLRIPSLVFSFLISVRTNRVHYIVVAIAAALSLARSPVPRPALLAQIGLSSAHANDHRGIIDARDRAKVYFLRENNSQTFAVSSLSQVAVKERRPAQRIMMGIISRRPNAQVERANPTGEKSRRKCNNRAGEGAHHAALPLQKFSNLQFKMASSTVLQFAMGRTVFG
jgi:hypothetical protein